MLSCVVVSGSTRGGEGLGGPGWGLVYRVGGAFVQQIQHQHLLRVFA